MDPFDWFNKFFFKEDSYKYNKIKTMVMSLI